MSVKESLEVWVRGHLGRVLGVAPDTIELDRKLGDYGLDSVDAVLMAGELEEQFNIEINPATFIRHPTFASMIEALAARIEAKGTQ